MKIYMISVLLLISVLYNLDIQTAMPKSVTIDGKSYSIKNCRWEQIGDPLIAPFTIEYDTVSPADHPIDICQCYRNYRTIECEVPRVVTQQHRLYTTSRTVRFSRQEVHHRAQWNSNPLLAVVSREVVNPRFCGPEVTELTYHGKIAVAAFRSLAIGVGIGVGVSLVWYLKHPSKKQEKEKSA